MPHDEISRAERLAELRRSEHELADFFENVSIPFHWVGPDGIILRANRAELEIFGYVRDEYVGHRVAEFHVDQEVIEDGKRLGCVQVWRSATRDFSAFEAICRQFTFPMGIGLPGRVWKNREATWIPDVTQDNNFPRASVVSREGLRGAFAFPIKLGGEILGIMEFFSSDIRQPDEPLLKTVEAISRKIGQISYRLRAEQELHKKNKELQAAIEEFQVMQEELRAQNEGLFQTQAAVENERKRYQDLFEFAPDGDLVTDIHGNIFEANQAAVKQLNTPLAALVGKPITDFVHPQDKMSFCADLMSIPIDSAVKKWEGRLVPTESNPFDGALTVIAVRDAREHPVGLRWLIHDVTEHKRVVDALRRSEEKLRQQSQELEQQLIASGRLVSLGEITASMAHEFNNPLGIIMGFIEDMLSGTDPADPNYRPLKIVDEESKRCKKIISDLMEYARPRSTELCLTNVAASIEKTLQLVENRLYKQKVAVVKAFEADLPQIYADPQQLEQVLINLYLNAIDAMPDSGTLTVETKVEWVDRSPSGIVLRLADTGFGIDENNLAKIFQPFFSAKKRRGLGLGLPICARIVKNHGGRIDVKSRPGQGTTFKLYLLLNHEVVGNQGEAG